MLDLSPARTDALDGCAAIRGAVVEGGVGEEGEDDEADDVGLRVDELGDADVIVVFVVAVAAARYKFLGEERERTGAIGSGGWAAGVVWL